MEITGKLIASMPLKSGMSQKTGKSWQSKEYVLEIPGQYVRHFAFTVFGEERLKQFNLRKDEEITVSFDIDAHEWNGRWFNEIRAYKVERVGQQAYTQQQPQPQPAPNYSQQPYPAPQPEQGGDNADDLPF